MTTLAHRSPSRPWPLLLALWVVLALLVGGSGALAALPVPPPAVGVALTLVLLLLLRLSASLREWALSLGAAQLVALHLVRFVGIYFLVLNRRGILPDAFAVPAGWGDIVVAVGAVLLLLFARPFRTPGQRRALLAWNAVGLADILLVLANGMRLALEGGIGLAPFTRLPLGLLPTLIVPAIIASHVLIFVWARRPAGT